MRASGPGSLTVTAAMSAPLLRRATRLPGWIVPQSQLLLRPGLLSVQAERRVVECRLELFDPPAGDPPADPPGADRPKPPKPSPPSPKGSPSDSPRLGMTLEAPAWRGPVGWCRGGSWSSTAARWLLTTIPARSSAVLTLRARVSPRAARMRSATATLRAGGIAGVRAADAIAVRPTAE